MNSNLIKTASFSPPPPHTENIVFLSLMPKPFLVIETMKLSRPWRKSPGFTVALLLVIIIISFAREMLEILTWTLKLN